MKPARMIIAVCTFLSVSLAQSNLTGSWQLVHKDGREVDTVLIRQSEGGTVLKKTDDSVFSKAHHDGSDSIRFNLEGLQFIGKQDASQREIQGTTKEAAGKQDSWKAVRIGSVWVCGNHTPPHSAASIEMMKQLTGKFNCAHWHRSQ